MSMISLPETDMGFFTREILVETCFDAKCLERSRSKGDEKRGRDNGNGEMTFANCQKDSQNESMFFEMRELDKRK